MYLAVILVYSLTSHKRKQRLAQVWETLEGPIIESELPGKLLLPTRIPQEWLPAELRTGASGPVRSWIDRSFSALENDDAPEGLPSSLGTTHQPSRNVVGHNDVEDPLFRPHSAGFRYGPHEVVDPPHGQS